MLLPLLLLLQGNPLPIQAAPVQSLLRVDAARLSLRTVRSLDLDVAAFTRTGEVELVCDAQDRTRLRDAGIPFTVVHEDLAGFYAARLTPREEIRGTPALGAWLTPAFGAGSMGGYYTFAEIVSVLDQIHAAYPALTTAKSSIGTSHEGRTLWAIKVSDNPGTDEAEPEARFDALHHAREPESMQASLWMLLALLERYGSDPLSTYLVDEREIWFVPCVNPDGYVYNQTTDPSGGGLWRKNRRANGGSFGVDLNRNYAHEWGFDDDGSSPTPTSEVYRGPSAASEPEVAAMQAFIDARDFQTALSVHTYSDLWLWPWGYIAAGPANGAEYDELGALATEVNGYLTGPAGSTLYLANGVTDDYDHGVHGTMAFTPEIGGDGDGFWPATARIVPLAEENELAFLRTAWAAGAYVHELARTSSEVGDGDGFLEAGETLELVTTARNSGRLAAGTVEVLLASSTPGVSVTTGLVSLGNVASFSSASHAGQPLALTFGALPDGTRVDYVVSLRYQGFTQEFPDTLFLGQPRLFLTDDLEADVGWTVGAPGDGATTGVWVRGNPVGTSNGGEPLNPEDDATAAPGVACFATGNGSTSAGGDDVDGGPTTLISPRLDLSGVSSAGLSYRRWFALATTLDDQLEISASDDDGASWVPLETVSGANANSWIERDFALEDHVALTDEVRLRFVTGDSPNNSLTEAGVDELAITTFASPPLLNFYGSGEIGSPLALHVSADPGKIYAVRASATTANVPTGFGTILIQLSTSFTLTQGTVPASGLARTLNTIPDDPGLIGATFYAQAVTVGPLRLSNRAAITFQ